MGSNTTPSLKDRGPLLALDPVCDPERGMPGTQREQGPAAANGEAGWVLPLGALLALLGFLLGLGVPEAPLEIGIVDVMLVGLVATLVYRIEVHLDTHLLRGRPGVALSVAAVSLGAIAGILAERASSADEPSATRAMVVYERQLGDEVFGPLLEAGAGVFEAASAADPVPYAASARELSEAYGLASDVLGGIEPARRGDQALHSLLVARLAAVGEAYARLGAAAADGVGKARFDAAQAEVRSAGEDLLRAQEALGRRGYRVSLAA